MKKNKKYLLAVGLGIVLVGAIVAGTIAWLTQRSTLVNSFTVGTFEKPTTSPINPSETISIDGHLYEPSWDNDADHKLIPGVSYDKDPYVGIGMGSEDATVYVYVKNNFSNKVYFNINSGWEAVEANAGSLSGSYTSGLFKYTAGLSGASAGDVWTSTPLFSTIITADDATSDDFTVAEDATNDIVISSFIHQTKNGNNNIDEAAILEAAKDAFGIE